MQAMRVFNDRPGELDRPAIADWSEPRSQDGGHLKDFAFRNRKRNRRK
jgi:hypothetical protein